jgi:hypothetical protein
MHDSSPFPKKTVTNPYFTHYAGWSRCEDCYELLEAFDFIQRPLRRPRGDKTVWHYDCADPKGAEVMLVAGKDWLTEASRGHKAEVGRYHEHRDRTSNRRD